MPFFQWHLVSVRRSAGRPIIPPKQQYKLADLCRALDIQPYVLRYWQTEFPVLASKKGASARREYDAADVETIRRIKELLYDEGYTIARAKKKLASELEEGGVRGRPVIVTGTPADNGEAPAQQTPGGDVVAQEAAGMAGGNNRPPAAHGAATAGPVPDAQPAALPPGSRIAEYEIVRALGAGGFGITYLAFDHRLDGPVAIKEYFPADLATRGDAWRVSATATTKRGLFAWGLDRFLEEARAIYRFRHPNVVRAHRYLEANGTAYIVMEYVEGESLKAILDRRGRLSPEEWRPWMEALLEGLAHVHSHDYLHRDIKPANIVVRAEDGEPVLIDFGSARVQHRDRTHTQVLTAGYAPIEQYSSDAAQGPPADIYALAAVSHRALTGNAVPSAPDRVLNDEYEPLAESVSSADPMWLSAIDQALALRPQNRPQTAGAWRVALGAEEARPPRERPPGPTRPRASRHWWWAVPALFTLSIVALRLANGPPGSAPPPSTAAVDLGEPSGRDEDSSQARRPTASGAILDVGAEPIVETLHLRHGFAPNPGAVAVGGGGGIDVSYLGGNCVGFAAPRPNVRLHWSGTSDWLGFAFHSEDGDADASLIVNLPDGSWICDDDSGDGLNPLIGISAPPEGQYDIWVGVHGVSRPHLHGELLIGEASETEEATSPPGPLDANTGDEVQEEGSSRTRRPTTPAATLDVNAEPVVETLHLSHGFAPNPGAVAVPAGGGIDVSYLGGNCVGFAAAEPDVRLHWGGTSDWLGFAFHSEDGDADASLIVNLPDGSWICDDDSGDGLDPLIGISAPPEGRYDIWVATHSTAPPHLPGDLLIGEASETEEATSPSPPPHDADVGDRARNDFFTRGSHQDDVLRLQGTPTDILRYETLGRETWYYGLSSVTISTRTRTVLDWSNHGAQLKVSLLPGNDTTDAPTFTRGSHQDDVLRLQGTPTDILRYETLGRETWYYGLSSVTISTRTRTVLDWSNHGAQLKVSLLPGNDNQ